MNQSFVFFLKLNKKQRVCQSGRKHQLERVTTNNQQTNPKTNHKPTNLGEWEQFEDVALRDEVARAFRLVAPQGSAQKRENRNIENMVLHNVLSTWDWF